MFDLILARPGLSVSQLANLAGLNWTSTRFHVACLTSAKLVASVRVGRHRLLFPPRMLHALDGEAAGLLAEPACLRVAVSVAMNPGRRVWELSDMLSMSDRAVYHHLKRLVAADLVRTSRPQAYRGLMATPKLYAALAMRDALGDAVPG